MSGVQYIPVITIDGPSGTGKGTISRLLAQKLGFHFLDSGAIYRLLGLAANNRSMNMENEAGLVSLAQKLNIHFSSDAGETKIFLDDLDVSDTIRTEEIGRYASMVAVFPDVRAALLERQRAYRRPPGLVADGRDMGTVVFPDAQVKVFLTASQEERARRRYKQLSGKGIDVTLQHLLQELAARDGRDSQRRVAPLVAAADAKVIDTSALTIDEVFAEVVRLCEKCGDGRQASP